MGLRARLILIVTLGLGVSLAASLGVLLRFEENDDRRESSMRSASLLSALSVPMSVLLTQGRVADLDNLMGELAHRKDSLGVDAIVLVDAHGVVIAATEDAWFGAELAHSDPFIKRAIEAKTALQDPPAPARPRRVSVPVQTGVRWATLVGTLDEAKLTRALVERRRRLVLSAIAVSSLGLLVLILLLSIEVLTPLSSIVRMAERLAKGDLKARAAVRGSSELQVLSTTLNDAARKLAISHAELEAEVGRRTDALTAAYTQLADANERLERLALTDPLTGLFNRRYLEQALALEVTRQKRAKRPFSLLMVDVDHFKHYNDTHGHPAGDDVLRHLAKILQGSLRASDIVARVGGEEFVVVLLDAELPLARSAADKVRDAVTAHEFTHGDKQPLGRLTVSIGVASWPKHGETGDDVIAAADRALYLSKAAGRNRVTQAPEPLK
ncbi:MAG TPA: diguanylate cyclase [Myxococcota bacterium]